ncbi:MAG: helix-turn-helix transcriptional regulator [Gemmatimonadales bacterium]|nr:helix-turn-helix transcriptional regulator [Gemmatimonadales bacterium]
MIHIPSEQQLLQVLALALLEQSSLLGPKEIKYLRKACDLTQTEMAKLLGLRGHATVAERELGRSKLTNESNFFYRAIVARELWNLHLKKPGKSFLAPIHVDQLRKKLEHFTDFLGRPKSIQTSSLQLELGDHAWRKAA